MKEKQKRIAVINDLSGFGRCALSVSLPIISAMKIQCCPLPTAILSANTAFKNYTLTDFTDEMPSYISHWKNLGLDFDGICTGFLNSAKQIEIVKDFLSFFKKPDNVIVVDPIMGDNGHFYSTFSNELCEEMKKLLPFADILLPNLTEACKLLDLPYPESELTDEDIEQIAKTLSEQGPKKVVLTGIERSGYLTNFIYESEGTCQSVEVPKIGSNRCGTGDVFSSVFVGSMIHGMSIYDSVRKAADFVSNAIEYTIKLETPPFDGLCFEAFLNEL